MRKFEYKDEAAVATVVTVVLSVIGFCAAYTSSLSLQLQYKP